VRIGGENQGNWRSICSLNLLTCIHHGMARQQRLADTNTHTHTQKPKQAVLETDSDRNVRKDCNINVPKLGEEGKRGDQPAKKTLLQP
jgi:hypothetical protein